MTCGQGFDVVTVDRRDAVGDDCEVVRRTLPVGSAPTPVTVELLGWASAATAGAPGSPVAVVAPAGTLTACAPSDRRLDVFFRVHGLARRTSIRIQYDFATGNDPVALDSMRPREEGLDRITSFLAARAGPGLPNGPYTIRFYAEAVGVYTPVSEATVTRACP